MGALLDLAIESLNDIGRADCLPVIRREVIEGQAGLLITPETLDGGGIDALILLTEGGQGLLRTLAWFLVEDGLEFRLNLLSLLLRHVAQDVLHLVLDATLASGVGDLSASAFSIA